MANTRRNRRRSGSRKRRGGFIFQEIKNAANTVKSAINTGISKIKQSPQVAKPHRKLHRPLQHPPAHVAKPHQKPRHHPAHVALSRKHVIPSSHDRQLRNGTRKTGGRKSYRRTR